VVVTKFTERLTHPLREQESSLGNLMADAIAQSVGTDVVLLGAGSVRVKEMGPAVTLMDLVACFPYDDSLTRCTVSGADLKRMFGHWMRTENRNGEGECYQVNAGVRAVYSDADHALVSLAVGGAPAEDAATYTVTLQGYHAKNSESYLATTPAQLEAAAPGKIVASSAQTVLREWLLAHQNVGSEVEGRLTYE
jgi:5'-nucleotidase